MDTTSRGWNFTKAAREGIQTPCIHGRHQTVTENNVTARKNKKNCGDENLTSRGKGSTNAKDDVTGSVGAPVRKGRTVGCRYQCSKIECRAHRSGRRRATTKIIHCETRGRYGLKEHPSLGAVPKNH